VLLLFPSPGAVMAVESDLPSQLLRISFLLEGQNDNPDGFSSPPVEDSFFPAFK